jgi:hypothetical protein
VFSIVCDEWHGHSDSVDDPGERLYESDEVRNTLPLVRLGPLKALSVNEEGAN